MLKGNVSLSQISWKVVPQFRTCSCKTRLRSLVAVCPCGNWQHVLDVSLVYSRLNRLSYSLNFDSVYCVR